MLVYWLLFGYFATGALLTRDPRPGDQRGPFLILIGALLIAAAIGLRYDVGGDWRAYELLFSFAGYADLTRMLALGDPAYQFINWLVRRVGLGIWAVNLICGGLFAWGLHRFAKSQPDPWTSFVVAIPYLVVVVAMGYTRQATAIGILLAGLASIERGGSILRFVAYVAVAATFHKTAVVVLPLVIFAGKRNRLLNILAGVAGCILLYDLFLSQSVDTFVRNYIRAEYSSQGAAIRVVMNFVPAMAYFALHRRLKFDPDTEAVWRYFAIASLLMPILLFTLPSSTAVDRLSLYLIPLQLAVLGRFKYLFQFARLGKFMIILYSAIVLFTWLNFALHAELWLPYDFYPFF